MLVIPAIDVLNGQVVRLARGDYNEVTVYADTPKEPALSFRDQGATLIHIVDLDGAKQGRSVNHAPIRQLLEVVQGIELQVGGGIRTLDQALAWKDAGVSRVVIGTSVLKSPEWVESLVKRDPGFVVVALDARHGKVALEGWTEQSDVSLAEAAKRVAGWGVRTVLYTDISKDGMRQGPDIEGTAELQQELGAGVTVIASGGIANLDNIRDLAQAKVKAAVCGRALYSRAFDYASAKRAAQGLA